MSSRPPNTTTKAAASEKFVGEPMMDARQQQQQQGDNRGDSSSYQNQHHQQQPARSGFQPPTSQMGQSRTDAAAAASNDDTNAAAAAAAANQSSSSSSSLQQRSPSSYADSRLRYGTTTEQQLQHFSPSQGHQNQNVAATADQHSRRQHQQHQQQQRQHMSMSSSPQQHHHHHSFLGDIENDDFGPDVLILPLGSFAEDSPTRGSSDSSDEAAGAATTTSAAAAASRSSIMNRRSRGSPRSSPVVRSISGQLLQPPPTVPRAQQQQHQPISLYHYYPPPNHHQYYSQLAHAQQHHQMQGYAAPPTSLAHPRAPHQQHQAMPYAHPSYGYVPGYGYPTDSSSSSRQQQQQQQQQQWGSPLDDDPSFAPPDPRAEAAAASNISSSTTPEKHKRGRDEVFRSPPSTNKRRSPLAASPGNHTMIGAYGSFGMDTPGAGTTATWGEFSPMGGGGGCGPFDPLQPVGGDKTTTFTQSHHLEDLQMGTTPCKQDPMLTSSTVDQSPFSGFINDFARSPAQQPPPRPQQPYSGRPLEGVARSPLQTSSERRNQELQRQHQHQQHYQPMSTSSAMGTQSYHSSGPPPPPRPPPQGNLKQVRSSAPPAAPQNEAKPRTLWPHEPKSAPAMRIELGRGAQRSLEGINSMMRGVQPGGSQQQQQKQQQQLRAVPTRPHITPISDPQRYRLPHPGSHILGATTMYHSHPARASIKPIGPAPQQRKQAAPAPPPPSQQQQRPGPPPPARVLHHYEAPPAPTGSQQLVSKPSSGPRQPSSQHQQQKQQHANKRQAAPKPGDKNSAALATGKENPKPPVVAPLLRRSPCNCKKSKCLKLYCECFSAELFCQGCNCTDCHNIPENQESRDKAIKETRSKNPNAFKPRFNVLASAAKEVAATGAGHNMGCRCKRSECLKKYCECFQAGVLCSSKCKCKGCANIAGSQKLIDKRRKMKDVRGAEFAMRVSEEAWKGRQPPPPQPPLRQGAARMSPPAAAANRQSLPGGNNRQQLPPVAMHPMSHLAPPPPHHHPYLRPPYIAPQMGQMGFSPLGGMNPRTPGYIDVVPPNVGGFPQPPPQPHAPSTTTAVPAPPTITAPTTENALLPKITPAPRTPAVRVAFDPSSFRKKLATGFEEVTFPYFGPPPMPAQPKTTALAIFSYLSNKDVSQAALVCKTWKSLAEDEELWKFP